jgi:5-methyltetrahydropteroyltriglutamate--homocysteine methyltransferase
MRLSTDRILTTHVGSLPRPQNVVDALFAQDRGEGYDSASFETAIAAGVHEAVSLQGKSGVDVMSDGEMSKISYATYIRHRLTGFEPGEAPRATPQDLDEFPEFRDRLVRMGASPKYLRPICKAPIQTKDLGPVRQDIARMQNALRHSSAVEGFLNAASPGLIAVFQPNEYYASHEAYLEALAEAMRPEYQAIVSSGLLLQLDCPDLAMGRHIKFRGVDDNEFLRNAALQVEALNHALSGIPADRVRLHICWGNYEGPHTHDIPLAKILPIALKAKPVALLLEGANPRHGHDWAIWETQKLPDDKILVPGVVSTTTNYIEDPEVIADRILSYANLVGRDRVIAGTDCGFGTFAGFGPIYPPFCWMKLRALADGARIASKKLWGRAGSAE